MRGLCHTHYVIAWTPISLPVHVKGQIREEEKAIAELDRKVREMEREISKQRKEMGG